MDGLDTAPNLIPKLLLHQNINLLRADVQPDICQIPFQLFANLFPADVNERRQMGQGDGLSAVLVGGHLGDDLGGDVAGGGEAVGPLDEGSGDDGAVLEHVLQVHQVAVVHVLGEVVGVVEVDDALFVGLHNIRREQEALGDVS